MLANISWSLEHNVYKTQDPLSCTWVYSLRSHPGFSAHILVWYQMLCKEGIKQNGAMTYGHGWPWTNRVNLLEIEGLRSRPSFLKPNYMAHWQEPWPCSNTSHNFTFNTCRKNSTFDSHEHVMSHKCVTACCKLHLLPLVWTCCPPFHVAQFSQLLVNKSTAGVNQTEQSGNAFWNKRSQISYYEV